MTPERWRRIEAVFHEAADLGAAERGEYLDQACADDPSLRSEVEALLTQAGPSIAGVVSGLVQSVAQDIVTGAVGQRIGPYRVTGLIGQGGMGAVYQAVRDDDQYQKLVAIKLVKQGMASDFIVNRFRHERQILAKLDHPNIARLLDGGATPEGMPYFVMEFVAGKPVTEYARDRNLPVTERLRLFQQICVAVQYAHQNLIVHRDLKPGNILVTANGEPKLLDFGIAKLLASDTAEAILPTATVARMMTPDYASPEQVRGEAVTTTSDIYSLGAILYELLAGKRPHQFKNYTASEVDRVVCQTDPDRPSTAAGPTGRALTGDLDAIVLKAMRKEPERRYASADQFASDIRRHLEGLPVTARQDAFGYRAGKFVRRNKLPMAAAAMLVLSLIAGIVSTTRQAAIARREQARAESERARAERNLAAAERARDAERAERERAAKAERTATTEANRAKLEAATAEQTSEFLVSLFNVADPNEAKGKSVTAQELLQRGAQKIRTGLKDQPAVQGRLTQMMGKVYTALGLYKEAIPLLEESIEVRRRAHGDQSPEVSYSLQELAMLKYSTGAIAEAVALYQRTLEIQRKTLGDRHLETAITLNNLGAVNLAKGDLATAESYQRQALSRYLALYGEKHIDTARAFNNVGVVLRRLGNLDEAARMYRKALAIRRRVLGEEHTEVATTLHNLSTMLHEKGEFREAETLTRQALAVRRKLVGEDHPTTWNSMSTLGGMLEARSPGEAEALYVDVLARQRRKLLPTARDLLLTINRLAALKRSEGDLDGSEKLLRDALAAGGEALEPVDSDELHVQLGHTLVERRDWSGAEDAFRRALPIRTKLAGPEHRTVGVAMAGLASALRGKGDLAAAEVVSREAVRIIRKSTQPGHADRGAVLGGLGLILLAKGDAAEAEPVLREAAEVRRKQYPAGHHVIAQAECDLGAALTGLRRHDEAEPLLVRALEVLQTKRGGAHPHVQIAVQRLTTLYESWNKPEQLARYRALARAPE